MFSSSSKFIQFQKSSYAPLTSAMANRGSSATSASVSKTVHHEIENLDWDSKAEEELRSIEGSYSASVSKRKLSPPSNLDDDRPRSNGRLLPSWASFSTSSTISNIDPSRRRRGFSPAPCRFNVKVKYPQMAFGGCIIYCRTSDEVDHAAVELFNKIKARKCNEDQISLGFDIEWRPTFKQGAAPRKVALMQICMDSSHCYLMHIIHSGISSTLRSLLEDCSSVKVGVGIVNDARKILRDYNINVGPLKDLSEYANLKLGGTKTWSLSSLAERLTCKELAKPQRIRIGDWEATPLSKGQLQYAATDAFASWHIYEVLSTFPDYKPENIDLKKVGDTGP